MKKYSFLWTRTLDTEYIIEANSKKEAKDMFNNGNWGECEHITEGNTVSYDETSVCLGNLVEGEE